MGRSRPLNAPRHGDHLVTTIDGDVIWASDAAVERYGARKGGLVHRDDLDEPGRADIRQHYRSERSVKPVTGEPQITWTVYDKAGDPVPGGPADV